MRLTLAQLRATYSTKDPQLATRATLSELRGTVRGETFRWLAGLLAEVDRRCALVCGAVAALCVAALAAD